MPQANRALSPAEIRLVIRKNPTVFAALANTGATGAEDIARAVTTTILNNPAMLDSLVAIGMDTSAEAVAKMGLLEWIAAVDIVSRTAAQMDGAGLAALLYEEMSALCIGGGALQ